MLFLIPIVCVLTLSYGYYYDFDYFARTGLPDLNFNQTFFSSLANYHVNATPVSEAKYPWIAKVVHSSTADVPYMCTASCVGERLFITAARCIHTLKVKYTTVIYQNKHRLPVEVFVMPSNETKQGYDDIGFIVVKSSSAEEVEWKVVELYNGVNRTDNRYEWVRNLPPTGYVAIGYATLRGLHKIRSPYIQYNLTELNVFVGVDICAKTLVIGNAGFHVPCFHSCTVEQFHRKDALCNYYHGVEGGAILEIKSNRLLGVVTWGHTYNLVSELPSGLSIVNSETFFKDYECAKLIAGDKSVHTEAYYWQKVCDKLNQLRMW